MSYYRLVYHFTWGTKNRLNLISPDVEARLLPFIREKCAELGYHLYAVNCMSDHVHLLVGLKPTMRAVDVAKNLKGASSHYINHQADLNAVLYWQDGFGVVTIRASEIPIVTRYIQNQKVHHAQLTLKDGFEKT
jgi:REP element-mobilizing transposase RayT